MFSRKSQSLGFTLIELVVVIAIIGLLATVVLGTVSSARAKGRDARRAADLLQIRNAVELYYNAYGHYPIIATTWTSFDAPSYKNNDITNPSAPDLATALAPYLPAGMRDPKVVSGDSGYLYRSESNVSGRSYCILIYRTPEEMSNFKRNQIVMSRCVAVVNGQCTGINAIYYGVGTYAGGC